MPTKLTKREKMVLAERKVLMRLIKKMKAAEKKRAAAKPRAAPRARGPVHKKLNYTRPSPPMSATLFRAGHRARGNDGHIYKIGLSSNMIHRWVRA